MIKLLMKLAIVILMMVMILIMKIIFPAPDSCGIVEI